MKRIFTFLIAFLATMSGVVWGQSGSGTSADSPYTGNRSETLTLSAGTYYMEDFHINTSDIAVKLTGDVTLVIKGECSFNSSGDLGIQIPEKGATLTISNESTGILRVDGNRSSNDGTLAVGGDKNNASLMGPFFVEGGTVYVLGNMGHNGNHGSIEMHDGVAFVDGKIKGNQQISVGGILFDRTGDEPNTWYGTTYDDITLNSPLTGDIDNDGTMDDDKINLNLNSHTLTIGKGQKINMGENQFTIVPGSGKLVAYKVVYDANVTNGCTITGEAPTDYWLYGPETTFDILEGNLTCNGNSPANGQHQFFGWVNMSDDNLTVLQEDATPKKTSSTPTEDIDPNTVTGTEGVPVTLQAAWGAYTRTIGVTNHVAMDATTLLASPEGVISYGDANGMPNGITFNKETGTFSGTPDIDNLSGDGTYQVTVPITVMGRESETFSATITFDVDDNTPDLDETGTTISWVTGGNGTATYNGQEFKLNNLVEIKAGNRPDLALTDGVHYTVTYSYISNPDATTFEDNAATTGVTKIKNAGKYKVTAITAKDGQAEGSLTEEELKIDGQDIIITINRAKLTLSILQQSVPVNGSITSTITATGDNPTVSYNGVVTQDQTDGISEITFSGSLSTTHDMSQVSNSAKITATATNVTIATMTDNVDGDIANNYTVASITDGNLIVYLDLSGDDVTPELTPDPTEEGEEGGEGEDIYDATSKTFTFPYDGQSYTLSKLTVGQQEITLEESNVSYSYAEEENGTYTALTDGQEVKDAGWYKAKVSLNSTLYPNASNLEYIIHITPRDLNVTVADQTVKVGNVEQDPTITWDIVFDQSNNTNTITIADGDVVTGETVVFAEDATLSLTEAASTAVTNKVAGVYEEAITNATLALADGTEGNNFKAKNYELKLTAGTLTVIRVLGSDDDEVVGGEDKNNDDDLNDEDGNWDEGEVLFGLGDQNTKVTYDGQAHGIDYLYVKNGDDWVKVEGTLSVTYTSQETEDNDKTTNDGAVDAATYDVTITITTTQNTLFELPEGGYKAEITIEKAPLTITGTYTCDDISSASSFDASTSGVISTPYSTGVNNEDIDSFSGTFTLKSGVTSSQADAFEGTITASGEGFKASNYEITYNITLNVTGEGGDGGDEGDKTELDPDGGDVTGGEEGDDGEFPSSDDFILLSPDGETSASVYDGNEHALTVLKFGNTILNVGDDYIVSGYTSSTYPNVGESSLPKHAATYSATVTLTGDYEWNDGTTEHTFTNITINKRPMFVSFVETVSSVEDLKDINKLVVPEKMNNNRGLVTYESPIFSGKIEEPVDLGNGTYRVTIKRETFKISTNEAGNFYLSDYTIHVDTNGNGSEDNGDGEITEGEGGNEGEGGLGDGDDIVIDIEVDPNGEDNDGDGYIDRIDYCNIYEDEICEGVTVEFSRDVVREGQSVLVTVKVEEGFDTTKLALKFKRALFGYWEDLSLTPTENPGEYIIKNIYTDIYVRIEGAVPTGIESIDGAKVYAKDGSLFVQTPQQEKVLIISMTGAIVKNETQIGLRQYTGLNRGIYVVCVGDERFKVRL